MAKPSSKSKAVDLAKKIAKVRDGFVCQKCGRSKAQGWQMHGAHIMPETWAATAADPDNILTLCARCHSMGGESAHQNPIQFGRWFDEHYPGLYDQMASKAVAYSQNPFPKIDWDLALADLRSELKRVDVT